MTRYLVCRRLSTVADMNREWVLKSLRDEVKAAWKVFNAAGENLDLAIGLRRPTRENSDGEERLRWASRSYTIAARDLRAALDRLNSFLSDGTTPDDLKLNSTQQAHRTLDGRHSA
jgi:hypothetical protein